MLSGVSRKRSIRSNPCWFTEFCKSQCLSHFAAPFIVVRAETSVAESCKEAITVWRLPPTGERDNTLHWIQGPPRLLRRSNKSSAGIPGSHGSRSLTPSSDHRSAENPRTDEGSQGVVHGESVETHCVNDPSAGSPTETLLRLLLPLSDKVH